MYLFWSCSESFWHQDPFIFTCLVFYFPNLSFNPLPVASLCPSQSHVQGPRAGSLGPVVSRLISLIVYSLRPGTKDIKLTDQWAGARPWLINEALGGWIGGGSRGVLMVYVCGGEQVGWLTHNQQSNRWGNFCWAQIRGRCLCELDRGRFCFQRSWAHQLFRRHSYKESGKKEQKLQ